MTKSFFMKKAKRQIKQAGLRSTKKGSRNAIKNIIKSLGQRVTEKGKGEVILREQSIRTA